MAWFYSFLFAVLLFVGAIHIHAHYATAPEINPAQTTTIEKRMPRRMHNDG